MIKTSAMLVRSSRFARFSRPTRAGILVSALALSFWGLLLSRHPNPAPTPAISQGDLALYRAIVDRMRNGEAYEKAATEENRLQHYPLKPFVVIRPPLLATVLASLPNEKTGDRLLALLGSIVIATWTWRLHAIRPGPLSFACAAIAVSTGVFATLAGGGSSLFHESWAGLLIALSLALRTDMRFAAALAFGLLAALLRELAMPYLAVMATLAATERKRSEAIGFTLAIAVAAVALALHGMATSSLVGSDDPASQGWMQFGGWGFVLTTAKWNFAVVLTGLWAAAVIVPAALLGAAGWKGGTGLRLATILIGYTLGMMVIGRPENDYWGLMIAPLIGVGLYLAPFAIRDLISRGNPACTAA
jgi:hypothetical protein